MGCFTKGTKVKTPLGYATIESLKKGDLVKSYDTKVEAKVDSEVTETFLHENHDGYLVINGNIKTTSNHPFYSNGDWVDAGELSVGDKISFDATSGAGTDGTYTIQTVPNVNSFTFKTFQVFYFSFFSSPNLKRFVVN